MTNKNKRVYIKFSCVLLHFLQHYTGLVHQISDIINDNGMINCYVNCIVCKILYSFLPKRFITIRTGWFIS